MGPEITLGLGSIVWGMLQKALSSTSKIPLGPFLTMSGWAGLLLPHHGRECCHWQHPPPMPLICAVPLIQPCLTSQLHRI
jgi:hypothetical protein